MWAVLGALCAAHPPPAATLAPLAAGGKEGLRQGITPVDGHSRGCKGDCGEVLTCGGRCRVLSVAPMARTCTPAVIRKRRGGAIANEVCNPQIAMRADE